MATVEKVLSDLRKFISRIPGKAVAGGTVVMQKVMDDLRIKSPVDTSRFKGGWRYTKNPSKRTQFASMSVSNHVHYGYFLEMGSEKGQWPWPSPGSKTVFGPDGKIYSTQAVGGVVRPLLTDSRVDAMAKQIADRIMSGLPR